MSDFIELLGNPVFWNKSISIDYPILWNKNKDEVKTCNKREKKKQGLIL